MKQLLIFLLGFTGIFAATTSTALAAKSSGGGFFFDETFFPVYVNGNDTQSFNTSPGVATKSGVGYDFRTSLGYTFGGNYLVGFTYNTYGLTTNRDAVAGGDSSEEEKTARSEYGPTVGYVNNGWKFLVTVFLGGTKKVDRINKDETGTITGNLTFENTQISGTQVTFGYNFAISEHFELGPSLIFKSVTFANQSKVNHLNASETYADAALFTKSVENTLSPMLSMQFRF